jgi:hypothetical protein
VAQHGGCAAGARLPGLARWPRGRAGRLRRPARPGLPSRPERRPQPSADRVVGVGAGSRQRRHDAAAVVLVPPAHRRRVVDRRQRAARHRARAVHAAAGGRGLSRRRRGGSGDRCDRLVPPTPRPRAHPDRHGHARRGPVPLRRGDLPGCAGAAGPRARDGGGVPRAAPGECLRAHRRGTRGRSGHRCRERRPGLHGRRARPYRAGLDVAGVLLRSRARAGTAAVRAGCSIAERPWRRRDPRRGLRRPRGRTRARHRHRVRADRPLRRARPQPRRPHGRDLHQSRGASRPGPEVRRGRRGRIVVRRVRHLRRDHGRPPRHAATRADRSAGRTGDAAGAGLVVDGRARAASETTVLGVGAPFWALLLGVVVHRLLDPSSAPAGGAQR